MVLGSTRPLTEMSIRNLPGGKGRLGLKADNLTEICSSFSRKFWSLEASQTYGPPRYIIGIVLPFIFQSTKDLL
jgi:hypothetical protein